MLGITLGLMFLMRNRLHTQRHCFAYIGTTSCHRALAAFGFRYELVDLLVLEAGGKGVTRELRMDVFAPRSACPARERVARFLTRSFVLSRAFGVARGRARARCLPTALARVQHAHLRSAADGS